MKNLSYFGHFPDFGVWVFEVAEFCELVYFTNLSRFFLVFAAFSCDSKPVKQLSLQRVRGSCVCSFLVSGLHFDLGNVASRNAGTSILLHYTFSEKQPK